MPTEDITVPELACEPGEIHAQLERIAADTSFRNSKRLIKFLRFVVLKSLTGASHELKERSVGSAVFGRPIDYDLTTDPVVRVAASEVRKRLAQYYVQQGHENELRFELPPGSYHVQIVRPSVSEKEPFAPAQTRLEREPALPLVPPVLAPVETWPAAAARTKASPRRRWFVASASVIVVAAAALTWWFTRTTPASQLAAFWEPFWSAPSTLICVGDLNSFMNPPPTLADESLEHVMTSLNHVGPNDLLALARISGILGSRNKAFNVLEADSATLTDLRQQPDVLIGASDNRWTTTVLQNARFRVERDSQSYDSRIVDATQPNRMDWKISLGVPLSKIRRDFALVSRISGSVTGQPQLVVAGLGPYGTAAASEFVTNPVYFRQFAEHAPTGWRDRNIQILLSTDVIDGRSGPPHIEMIDVH